jgi:small neutral amino acid transporter SnatA (MarC family)
MDIIPAELGFGQALATVFVALFVLTHPFGNFAIFLGMIHPWCPSPSR